MSILVTGSTGTIGTQVVAEIARRGVKVHALINEAPAKRDDSVIPVKGDTTDMDSMRKAMSGMTTLFLLNPVVIDELSRALLMLDLAQKVGIQRVVYFSMFNADTLLDCPHACAKYAAELMIHNFGIPTTILRPNYFFQNDAPAAKSREMPMPIGSLGTSMADARDIGEVAAIELIRRDRSPDPLPTGIIEIHGPDVITAQSAVRTWTEVLGEEVTYPGDDLRAFERKFEKMASSVKRQAPSPTTLPQCSVGFSATAWSLRTVHRSGSPQCLDGLCGPTGLSRRRRRLILERRLRRRTQGLHRLSCPRPGARRMSSKGFDMAALPPMLPVAWARA